MQNCAPEKIQQKTTKKWTKMPAAEIDPKMHRKGPEKGPKKAREGPKMARKYTEKGLGSSCI